MVFDPENVRSPMRPGNLYDAKGSSMARANSFRQSSSDHFIGSLKRIHQQMKLERSFHRFIGKVQVFEIGPRYSMKIFITENIYNKNLIFNL